jgi:hypothetical protein
MSYAGRPEPPEPPEPPMPITGISRLRRTIHAYWAARTLHTSQPAAPNQFISLIASGVTSLPSDPRGRSIRSCMYSHWAMTDLLLRASVCCRAWCPGRRIEPLPCYQPSSSGSSLDGRRSEPLENSPEVSINRLVWVSRQHCRGIGQRAGLWTIVHSPLSHHRPSLERCCNITLLEF